MTIPAGKDGITLFSEPALQAVIKGPPAMLDPKAIVRVSTSQNVTIRHFTITGPGDGGCDSIRWGVRVDTGGSALITDNHITEIRDTVRQRLPERHRRPPRAQPTRPQVPLRTRLGRARSSTT